MPRNLMPAPDVPGAQTQPVDGDWLSRLGKRMKQLGAGAIDAGSGEAPQVSLYGLGNQDGLGDNSNPFTPEEQSKASHQMLNLPPATTLGDKMTEAAGGALGTAPISGGPVGQAVNVGLGMLPEAAKAGFDALLPPAEAGEDPYAQHPEPDPYAAMSEQDKPAPYAPRLDGMAPNAAPDDPYYKPDDWLDSITNDKRYWVGAAATAATALGAFALMKYNASSAVSLAERVGELTGDKAIPTVTRLATQLNTGILDRNAPVKDFFATMDPANAKLFGATVDTKMNNAAVNQKIASFQQTGEYPGTGISGTAPVDFYTSVAKRATDVDPAVAAVEQHLGWEPSGSGVKQFDNLLKAANELDIRRAAEAKWMQNQYANTGIMPTARTGTANEIRPNFWDKSTSELEQYVRAAKLNNTFNDLHEMHKGMMQDMGDYMNQKGLITAQELAEFRGAYPNYVPITQRAEDPAWGWIKDKMMPKFDRERWDNQQSLLSRSLEDQRGFSGSPGDSSEFGSA